MVAPFDTDKQSRSEQGHTDPIGIRENILEPITLGPLFPPPTIQANLNGAQIVAEISLPWGTRGFQFAPEDIQ